MIRIPRSECHAPQKDQNASLSLFVRKGKEKSMQIKLHDNKLCNIYCLRSSWKEKQLNMNIT